MPTASIEELFTHNRAWAAQMERERPGFFTALMQQQKPLTARQLEDRFGGVAGPLKMPKHDVRQIVQVATTRGFLTGGERKPLAVTRMGNSMASNAPAAAEIASKSSDNPPRKKTQANQPLTRAKQ